MDYKKLLPSREIRLKIINLFNFIPDKIMINIQYFIKTGRKLNLRNPKRYTEKSQWYKLYYRNSLMTHCADKYGVRQYAKSKGLDKILIPLYGVYDLPEHIDFDKLPKNFVLKTTNSSHTNYICKDKNQLNIEFVKGLYSNWLDSKSFKSGREWPYYNIKPRIICEKYLDSNNGDLIDYKFMCFNGKVEYLFVNSERNSDEGMKFGIYNRDFQLLPFRRKRLRDIDEDFDKPANYDEMVKIAEILSDDFPHVRVDLYNISGEIYLGEMTFFHGSGYIEFEPDEFDYILGGKFILPKS